MSKILLYISFVGTNYCGYQIQPNGVTIQQRLNEAAEALFGYPCDVVGCSRTDSGVHAAQFCATVSKKGEGHLLTTVPTNKIPLAISKYLPSDISVYLAREVDDDFHARYDVVSKEYIYRIWNSQVRNPFEEGRSYHYPKAISRESINLMNEAAKHFIGTKDFTSFMAADSKIVDATRTVYSAEVERYGDLVTFRVSANGFLYNMVRIMTGTLLAVAEGKILPENIDAIIESKDRSRAGFTAPPCGLYLNKVDYNID